MRGRFRTGARRFRHCASEAGRYTFCTRWREELASRGRHLVFLLDSEAFEPGFLEYMLEDVIVQLGHLGGGVLHCSMFDSAGEDFGFGCAFLFAEERLDDEINHVAEGHVAGEPTEEAKGLHRVMEELVDEKAT